MENKIIQFNSIVDCINYQEEQAKLEFEKKNKSFSYEKKCASHDCLKEAKYIWKPTLFIRLKNWSKMMSPYPFIPQYCRKHFLSQTRNKKYQCYLREGFVELTQKIKGKEE